MHTQDCYVLDELAPLSLFNVLLYSYFGDLVLLSSHAASFTNSPRRRRVLLDLPGTVVFGTYFDKDLMTVISATTVWSIGDWSDADSWYSHL